MWRIVGPVEPIFALFFIWIFGLNIFLAQSIKANAWIHIYLLIISIDWEWYILDQNVASLDSKIASFLIHNRALWDIVMDQESAQK